VILSACYALYLYRRIIFGIIEKPSLQGILDLSPREIAILAPLVVLTIYYGVRPQAVLDPTAAPVEQLVRNFEAALSTTKTAALPTIQAQR
jgi:NADH-quinone oxidoreductase subunit M